mmetsp:Transcript_39891/g.63966  ORF Transcript_39891/g.63966 Transcript_39891/m.63966 type:complete len:116 (+) Transcript_39891:133-480(+)
MWHVCSFLTDMRQCTTAVGLWALSMLALMTPIKATEAINFNVVAYMPEYRLGWEPERWDLAARHLTHLILFSLEIEEDGTLAATDRFPSSQAHATNTHLTHMRARADSAGKSVRL